MQATLPGRKADAFRLKNETAGISYAALERRRRVKVRGTVAPSIAREALILFSIKTQAFYSKSIQYNA
jgi:hypothetical protein